MRIELIYLLFIFVAMLAAILAVIAGNAGVSLPLMPICAFYFSMKITPAKAFPVLLVAAGLLDAVWMHKVPGELVAVLLVMSISAWWRSWGDLHSGMSLLAASVFVGVSACIGRLVPLVFSADGTAGHAPAIFIAQLLWTLLLLTPSVWILERIFVRRINGSLREAVEENEA